MTVRAYVLIEASSETMGAVEASFAHGLGNCLALGHRFASSPELVVQLACDRPEDLNRAVTVDFINLPGVTRVTPWLIEPAD